MKAMIEVRCATCRAIEEVTVEHAGRCRPCLWCGEPVRVPGSGSGTGRAPRASHGPDPDEVPTREVAAVFGTGMWGGAGAVSFALFMMSITGEVGGTSLTFLVGGVGLLLEGIWTMPLPPRRAV